jgi:flotillin
MDMGPIWIGLEVVAVGLVFALLVAARYRRVVSTNDVHIVQSTKRTVSYGKDQTAGNTYYAWPAWLPRIGIKVIRLPVSVFSVSLKDYDAYDKGRVPFVIDVLGFFRIDDPNTAAQRVHSFEEVMPQLEGILKGASRSILAKSEIEEILEERSKFGLMFTEATNEQLRAWGVTNVKNIELMDIRDDRESQVIANIMAKKKSLIERESRVAVASNIQAAQEAEIIAKREVAVRQQEAEQQVGIRTAQKDREIGVAQQQAQQIIKEQEAITTTKAMAVRQIEIVRAAEIERDKSLVSADQDRKTAVIRADGVKQQVILEAEGVKQRVILEAEGVKQQVTLEAEGKLQEALRNAEGVEAEGKAKGEAEKAFQLASVTAQVTLAEKVGANAPYQAYLINVRGIEANQQVGIAQAEALKAAKIKVIVTADGVDSGMKTAMDVLTAKGGAQLGAMAEAFAQTDAGRAILDRAGVRSTE